MWNCVCPNFWMCPHIWQSLINAHIFSYKSAYLTDLVFSPPILTNTGPNFCVLQVTALFYEFSSKMLENLLDLKKYIDKSRVVWLIRIRRSFIHFSSCFTSGVLVIPLQQDSSSPNFITAHMGMLGFTSGPDEMQKLPLHWEIKSRISYHF